MNNSKLDYDDKIPQSFQHEFHNIFPYFDYSNLLSLIKLWVSNAKVKYIEDGITASSTRLAKKLDIMDILLARIMNDNYYVDTSKFTQDKYQFNNVDGFQFTTLKQQNRITKRTSELSEKRKKYDIEYLFLLFKRYLLVLWD